MTNKSSKRNKRKRIQELYTSKWQQLRHNKLFLVLPIIGILILTIALWSIQSLDRMCSASPNIFPSQSVQQNDADSLKNLNPDIANKKDWGREFLCEIKITDVAIAIFTLFLVLVGLLQAYWLYATVSDGNKQHIITNRAFLFIKSYLTMPTGIDVGKSVDFWRITPVVENTGNTPTKHMVSFTSAELREDQLPDNFDFPDTPYPDKKQKVIYSNDFMGPRSQLNISNFILSIADVQAIAKCEKYFYIWGWCDYNDVFSGTKRHRMEFCSRLVIVFDPTNPNNNQALLMSLLGRHNAHDDLCYRQPAPYKN